MDPLTLGVLGGGAIVNALGSLFGGKSQADAVREVNAKNEALTRESWARDDTAVRRRVADLDAAGLNVALAAGSAAGNASPIPMQVASDNGAADALKSAGQALTSYPTVESMLKRDAASTLAAQANARMANANAGIAEHDYQEILKGRDPRDKSFMNQLPGMIEKLADSFSPTGKAGKAAREAGQFFKEDAFNSMSTSEKGMDNIMQKAMSPEQFEKWSSLPYNSKVKLFREMGKGGK